MWSERAAKVRASGTPVMVTGSAERWFAPGFLERQPEVGATLLHSLQDADREGYAQVCDALAAYDVRDRLAEITSPVLAIAGALDQATPPWPSSRRSPRRSPAAGSSCSTAWPTSRPPSSRPRWRACSASNSFP